MGINRFVLHSIIFDIQMIKKHASISRAFSQPESLNFSAFNYFGLGAVLVAVAESFWINFSAYYLNSILPSHGNLIFLLAQVFEAVGILLGWLVLSRFGDRVKVANNSQEKKTNCITGCCEDTNLHMFVYIGGAILLIFFLPPTFFMPLSNIYLVFTFSLLSKIGSGLMIISQVTIIPKITNNRNRRRKLVEKVTQFGLGGTFVAMLLMTTVSVYVNFIWKYFIGVSVFAVLGGICSIIYVMKVRTLINHSSMHQCNINNKIKVKFANETPSQQGEESSQSTQWSLMKTPRFYIYAFILMFCTLYMDIVIAIYPYFLKSFINISQFRYLSCICALYLSAFICSFLTKNAFVFSGVRSLMSIGFVCCIFATILLVIGLADRNLDTLMIVGTCLTGIAKVIGINCAMNLINQYIGKEVKGREFVYAIYYFLEKVMTGLVLFLIIRVVYVENSNVQFLHFSEIYLPFILYSLSWVLVMIDRTVLEKLKPSVVMFEQKTIGKQLEGKEVKKDYAYDPSKFSVNDEIVHPPQKVVA